MYGLVVLPTTGRTEAYVVPLVAGDPPTVVMELLQKILAVLLGVL